MTERGQTARMLLITLVLIGAWVGLAFRLSSLHLGSNFDLQARIQNIREVEQPILVGRGRILDCNGKQLALDLAVNHVSVDPKTVLEKGQRRFVASQLARVLQLDPAVILSRIDRPNRRQEYIKKYVSEDLTLQLTRMGLDRAGVFFDEVSQRNYPLNDLMCHVLGYSNQEGHGCAGLEYRLDKFLRGVPGLRVSEVDGRHREIYARRSLEIQPQQGADVYLTLDQNLQYFVETALQSAMETWNAKGAWAIIEDVKTGRILAMASRPAFNLNEFGTLQPKDTERLNRPIGYVFEPGSTFKVATIAAALNERVTTPRTVFDCENGAWHFAGRPLRDYHPHGRLSVADVLKVSSNIGAAKIAMLLGEEKLHQYLKDFGFGGRSGIDLPAEEIGNVPSVSEWSKLSISRIPMGQGISVTSLQMLNMLCCIANDGFLMRPHTIDRIVGKNGDIVAKPEPTVLAHPINASTAHLMRKLLTRVTEEGGTGTKARVEGYTVAGKTGSAQKAVVGGYSDSAHIASFMGFLPAERPAIAIMVVIDEPQPLHTGGMVAAPVFKEIAEKAIRYLDIAPLPEEQVYRFGDEIPSFEG